MEIMNVDAILGKEGESMIAGAGVGSYISFFGWDSLSIRTGQGREEAS